MANMANTSGFSEWLSAAHNELSSNETQQVFNEMDSLVQNSDLGQNGIGQYSFCVISRGISAIQSSY